jgi:hypothetical protein
MAKSKEIKNPDVSSKKEFRGITTEKLQEIRNPEVLDKKKLSGLCSTCKYADECCFPKDPNRPVFFCEEFEIEQAPVIQETHPDSSKEELSKTDEKFKGLCVNCEHRYECTFPKSESGVWHCEEYE